MVCLLCKMVCLLYCHAEELPPPGHLAWQITTVTLQHLFSQKANNRKTNQRESNFAYSSKDKNQQRSISQLCVSWLKNPEKKEKESEKSQFAGATSLKSTLRIKVVKPTIEMAPWRMKTEHNLLYPLESVMLIYSTIKVVNNHNKNKTS